MAVSVVATPIKSNGPQIQRAVDVRTRRCLPQRRRYSEIDAEGVDGRKSEVVVLPTEVVVRFDAAAQTAEEGKARPGSIAIFRPIGRIAKSVGDAATEPSVPNVPPMPGNERLVKSPPPTPCAREYPPCRPNVGSQSRFVARRAWAVAARARAAAPICFDTPNERP